jgi:hypothetical protein
MLEYNANFDRRFKSLKPSELKNYEYAAKYGPYPKEWYPEMRSKAMDILEQVVSFNVVFEVIAFCLCRFLTARKLEWRHIVSSGSTLIWMQSRQSVKLTWCRLR